MSQRDYDPLDLARAGFQIHQLEGFEKDNIENAFTGYIDHVIAGINDGKEASVYLCQGCEDTGHELLAAKIFKPRQFRAFKTNKNYRNTSKMRNKRDARHLDKGSSKAQLAIHRDWVKSEWRLLRQLFELGIAVPEPIACSDDGVLMEFIGSEAGAAPRLVNAGLSTDQWQAAADSLKQDINLMLEHRIVHGDLSAYNVLYDDGRLVIIDVPQAMDLHESFDAYTTMQRDLSNLETFFERQGIQAGFPDLLARLRF